MQKDTRIKEKIPHSSVCKEMSFCVPTSWEMLTQEQLRHVIRLIWLYQEHPDWEMRIKVAAFLYFTGVEVAKRTPEGWLCREIGTGRNFVLNPELLPSIVAPLDYLCHTDEMTVRLENIGGWTAYDFELQELPFGRFLEAEGYYQSFLLSKQESCLIGLAKVLYKINETEEVPELKEEILLGTFLWFNAVKVLLSEQFPHFFRPASDGGTEISRESLIQSMRTQMRALTKGDVTKEQYIRDNVDTWTALAELDASAKESEELNRKYGKK